MIIGIDPGTNGGLAIFDGQPVSVAELVAAPRLLTKMPEEEEDIYEWLAAQQPTHGHDPVTVFIENIPRWAGKKRFAKQTVYGASIASLYGNMKLCQGIAMGLGFKVVLLTPQKWQKAVGCTNVDKLEKGDWKRKLQAHAQVIFPEFHVTQWAADALLIAVAGVKLGY